MSDAYDFNAIEPKWQQAWEAAGVYRAANPGESGSEKPKFYVLDFFPYPSGAGLHVGHPLGYIASDIIARYMRMRGYNVLHPMGWDAFGLPAEQYAVETGVHPRETTQKNIETYKRQLRMIGLGYDWSREVATCDPDYYHWTQWIFLQLFNAWYDPEHTWTDADGRQVVGKARPIDDLPTPPEITAQGQAAVEDYRDEHRLAYLAEVPVNWCPALGTVLSNEEVTNEGRSERGNHPVYRRPLRQWMLRITEYAERLLADLDPLDWPEPIKLMQRNWIGRSAGAYVDFRLDHAIGDETPTIRVFTTRPDTLYGATYMVLAPEHNLVGLITTDEHRAAVERYCAEARNRSDLERTADTKTKTGVFTGAFAINPVNGERIPIWVADYVLIGYGTGSIMAVPAHDTRDYEFAEAFGLDIVQVVKPPAGADWRGFTGDGVNVNSPPADVARHDACDINNLPTPAAKRKITAWLEDHQLGEGTVQYKLRDWLFSRQRYWGEPFPIVHRADGRAVGLDEDELPVTLPHMEDFRPTPTDDPNAEPQTPLSKATDWLTVTRRGQTFTREVNTMPQWAGSCWYYLRFIDARNEQRFADPAAERYWMGGPDADGQPRVGGIDLYMGGAEHAVLHLLYARFWHKLLYDLGHVSTPEPFHKLFNQGMIQSYAYRDERGVVIPLDQVEHHDDQPVHKTTGAKLTASVEKMSKSLKNVVNPDQIISDYGADTLRLYEMYMGPLEASKPWNTRDIVGVHRFLQRVWRLVVVPDESGPAGWKVNPKITDLPEPNLERLLHKTVQKVAHDLARFALNTAIAQMIVWVNEAVRAERLGRDQLERFLFVLFPFAPHIAAELWERLGHADLINDSARWPAVDENLTRDETVEIAVQVKGKVRGRITVTADASEEAIVAAARDLPTVQREIGDKPLRKTIIVPGRLVNLIA